MPIEPEPNQVAPAQRKLAIERPQLRDVADPVAPLARRHAGDRHRAAAQVEEPQQHLQQRRLARAVGPEHREELAGAYAQVQPVPERSVAQPHRRSAQLCDRGQWSPSALRNACAWCSCQSWKLASAGGNVSAIATTGTPELAARERSRFVTGVTACEL